MGANPTQAQGVVLWFLAFTLIAIGLATDMNVIAMLAGIGALAGSIVLLTKCKPWEHRED